MTRYEYCCKCGDVTGRAGASEDSLYSETEGPFCEACLPDENISPITQLAALQAKNKMLLEALKNADQFITNGIGLGFIRMPDKDTPDSAHQTPGIVSAAIAAVEKQT